MNYTVGLIAGVAVSLLFVVVIQYFMRSAD